MLLKHLDEQKFLKRNLKMDLCRLTKLEMFSLHFTPLRKHFSFFTVIVRKKLNLNEIMQNS